MKLVELAQTEKQRETLAVGAGFLSFEHMLQSVEGITRFNAPPNIDGWMIDLNSDRIEVEWVKSTDGNCDTNTLTTKQGIQYGTYDKFVVGFIHSNPDRGNTYREVKLDVWNSGDEDPNDYVILEEMEEAPEYVHELNVEFEEDLVVEDVHFAQEIKLGKYDEETDTYEGELVGEREVVVFEEGSSDTFILNGVTYTDWGDEINVKEGTYGIYKEVGKEPNESTKCYVLVNF